LEILFKDSFKEIIYYWFSKISSRSINALLKTLLFYVIHWHEFVRFCLNVM